MVFVGVECFDPERRIFLHRGKEDLFELLEHVLLQELSSVLSAPDDVVLVLICTVVEVLNPHETSVSPERETCKVPFTPALRRLPTFGDARLRAGFPGKEKVRTTPEGIIRTCSITARPQFLAQAARPLPALPLAEPCGERGRS